MKAATKLKRTADTLTVISIHAAREGGDRCVRVLRGLGIISIHAAREGGDQFRKDLSPNIGYFNPRRP